MDRVSPWLFRVDSGTVSSVPPVVGVATVDGRRRRWLPSVQRKDSDEETGVLFLIY